MPTQDINKLGLITVEDKVGVRLADGAPDGVRYVMAQDDVVQGERSGRTVGEVGKRSAES